MSTLLFVGALASINTAGRYVDGGAGLVVARHQEQDIVSERACIIRTFLQQPVKLGS